MVRQAEGDKTNVRHTVAIDSILQGFLVFVARRWHICLVVSKVQVAVAALLP